MAEENCIPSSYCTGLLTEVDTQGLTEGGGGSRESGPPLPFFDQAFVCKFLMLYIF